MYALMGSVLAGAVFVLPFVTQRLDSRCAAKDQSMADHQAAMRALSRATVTTESPQA